ncbi:MAG: hypothetical protein WD696_01130 [Bryobacteraceae bacterium]
MRRLFPSISDLLIPVFVILLFSGSGGWTALLSDGDTGWHIRTGELILDTGTVPAADPFSFSKPNAPWFAWEWLSEVVFALIHRAAGLKGLVFLSGTVLCAAAVVLFRHILWRGAPLHVAFIVTLLAVEASRIHFLARPHIFTILLVPIAMWLLDRDRVQPSRAVWLLVPLSAVWANLHGGFLVLISAVCLFAVGAWLRRSGAWRYTLLALACSAATFANPYGYWLHLHIAQYVRSDWILRAVAEFQSPAFRSESMYKFEILLFAGICLVPGLLRRKEFETAFLLVFWAHEALQSARHVPLYAMISAPSIAIALTGVWNRWTHLKPAQSILGTVRDIMSEASVHAGKTTPWTAAFLVLLYVAPSGAWPTDFPSARFPVPVVSRNAERLVSRRILTSDEWGGYLIYRRYPEQKVYMDGRSDFYGEALGREYLSLMRARGDWASILERRGFQLALLPRSWPLSEVLKRDSNWHAIDEDRHAILFERVVNSSSPRAASL